MSDPPTGIAIVGLAGRFPGAPDAAAFWRNLEAGVEAIVRFAPEELEGPPGVALLPSFVPARAVVADTDRFDAAFFGIGPREARVLDPQQRLFLECAWHALEDAGCVPERFRGTIGVFAGSAQSSYYLAHLHGHPELAATVDPLELKVGNDKDFLATTASYRLDLHGPSVNVSTACSTSLVAVHLACQALLTLECDLALAGGVTLSFPQRAGYLAPPGSILSPLGHCRAYDAAADGSVPGEAVAVVALRRLEDALADGDRVLAVIRGSALNNDGARKIGFTAPSVEGQAAVIAEALAVANVPAGSIGLIEGHGSGTPLGDMVELEALGRAFAGHPGRCALGSVKTAIGHCDAAAGIAGLVKATLALAHGTLPPSLGCEVHNPRFDWTGAPFWVPATAAPWPRGEAPRRAGVSSFGIGGTNAHVVLEEAPARAASAPPARPWQLLVLSAATPTALAAQTANVGAALGAQADLELADVASPSERGLADFAAPSQRGLADFAASLARGRRALRHRRFVLCRDRAEAAQALAAGEALATAVAVAGRPVAFLCSGVGDHYAGMAAGLYRGEPAFRAAFDRAAELALPLLGRDLRELVLEPGAAPGGALDLKRMLGRRGGGAQGGLEETRLLHPAVFAVSVATAALWASWGIQPSALLGYSLGEYVAAHLAGVLPLADALRLVVRRAELIASTPPGGMLAVALPLAALSARLEAWPALALAAESGPELCVVAGPPAALEDFAAALAADGVSARRLPTGHAVHTAEMAAIVEPFTAELAGLAWSTPRVPLVSNVTGDWLAPEAARDPAYWRRHLLSPVRFARGLATLTAAEPAPLLLEIGPGHGLATLANQNLQARGAAPTVALASLRPSYEGRDDQAYVLETLGRLWLAGAEVDWHTFHGPGRQKVELPLYPFERERYWIDPPRAAAAAALVESAPVESGGPELGSDTLGTRHRRPDLVRPYVAPTTSDERALAAIWEEVLGVAPVGVEDSFFELGGQSLLAPRILHAVATRLGCEVPLARLLAAPTVAALARAVAEARAAGAAALPAELEAPDLGAEAKRLAPTIRATAPPRPFAGDGEGSVLLTGATGFIGAFLLAELLASTRVRVRCQVRAASVEDAQHRVERNLVALGLEGALVHRARLELLPGDLAAPRWGLSEARFADLAAETTAIVHAGAWVNFTYPYAWLAPTNVGGTDTALELAGRSGAGLHFVSSLSALVADPDDPAWVACEDDPLARAEGHFGGYAETKWVAEHHLRRAQERGIRAAVYRPGLVAGGAEGRLGNTRDLMWSLLKGCLESGLAPALELPFDPVPADYLARAVVHLAQQPASLGRAFHFAHPAPPSWRSLFELAQGLGWKLEILPPAAWLRQMAPLVARSPEHALAPFWPLLSARFGAADVAGQSGELRAVRADDTHTRAGLEGSGLVCPPLDSALLTRWLEAFVEGGFLPAPSAEEVLR